MKFRHRYDHFLTVQRRDISATIAQTRPETSGGISCFDHGLKFFFEHREKNRRILQLCWMYLFMYQQGPSPNIRDLGLLHMVCLT